MKAIELFNLTVLEKIYLNECKNKLSTTSKVIYQNAIYKNINDKGFSISDLNSFNVELNHIKNFEKYKENFNELFKYKLISLNVEKTIITFNDVWVKYMNLGYLNIGNVQMVKANDFKDEMYNSHSLYEAVKYKYKIKQNQVVQLLQLFFQEQLAIDKTYNNENEVRKHFIYWCSSQLDKVTTTSAISTGKLL